MAKRRRSKYRQKKRRNRGPRRPSINFYDPQLNAAWEALQERRRRQGPLKPLKGIRFPMAAESYFFGPSWADIAASRPTFYESNYPAVSAEARSAEGQDGGEPHGFLETTLDYLSRPLYASAEGVADFQEELPDVINDIDFDTATLRDLGDMFRAGGAGAIQGFTGKKKTTYSQLLRGDRGTDIFSSGAGTAIERATGWHPPATDHEWWRKHDKTTAAVGLTADILLDPSTYIGVGLVGKAGTGARSFKNFTAVEQAANRIQHAVNAMNFSPIKAAQLKRFLSGEKFRLGFQSQKGAQAAEGKAIKEAIRIADRNALIVKTRVTEDTLENLAKIGQLGLRDRKGKFMSPAAIAAEAGTKAGDEAAELTQKGLIDDYRTIVNADYKKTLGIGTRAHRVPIIPSVAVETLAKIAQLKPLASASDFSRKYLQNSYKIIEDVYRIKTEALHLGRSATYMVGRYLDQTFRQIGKEERRSSWILGLKREPSHMTVTPPGGETKDAADLFSRHVDLLSHRVSGIMGELPYSPAELGANLPPGLPNFFRKKSRKEIAAELGLTGKKGVKSRIDKAWAEQDWFRDSLLDAAENGAIKGMKDGGHALWIATAAVEHAAARRQMFDNMADAFGFERAFKNTDEIAKKLVTDLEKRQWREVRGVPELRGTLFNPEVAEGIEKIVKLMKDQREWGGFVKFINRITNPLKFWYTQPNPGYHIRNILGDAFINWIDRAVNPADYRVAMRLLGWRFKGMTKFEKVGENEIPLLRMVGDPLENALNVSNKPIMRNSAGLRDARGNVKEYITDSELYAGINKHGIRQNFAVSQFGELDSEINTFGSAFADAVRPMSQSIRRMSEWREDYMRIAHFSHLVRTNPSKAKTLDEAMTFAADRVRMTHFDYTDFTKFEQQVASNVIPFYKWTRKAVPLMMRFMFEHPGKVIIPDKITANLAGAFGYWPGQERPLPGLGPDTGMEGRTGLENRFVPDWLVEGGYSPIDVPFVDNPMFVRYPSPFSDMLAFQGTDISQGPSGFFDTMLMQSHPLIRMPIELGTNHQSLFAGEDVPITDKSDYFLNQVPVPAFGQYRQASEGQRGRLFSGLTGLYAQELTPEREKNELYRRLFEGNLSPEENAKIREVLRYKFNVDI